MSFCPGKEGGWSLYPNLLVGQAQVRVSLDSAGSASWTLLIFSPGQKRSYPGLCGSRSHTWLTAGFLRAQLCTFNICSPPLWKRTQPCRLLLALGVRGPTTVAEASLGSLGDVTKQESHLAGRISGPKRASYFLPAHQGARQCLLAMGAAFLNLSQRLAAQLSPQAKGRST